jgi:hypothetical protein
MSSLYAEYTNCTRSISKDLTVRDRRNTVELVWRDLRVYSSASIALSIVGSILIQDAIKDSVFAISLIDSEIIKDRATCARASHSISVGRAIKD